MELRYEEWLPGPGLEGTVTAYWRVSGDGSRVHGSAVLPDGHIELVLNRGGRVVLTGPAYNGNQPDRAIVGSLSKAIRLKYGKRVETFGVRFHPARGAGFLGQPATALTDRLLPLGQVCPALDRAVGQLLSEKVKLETEAGRAALDRVLLAQLALSLAADKTVIALVEQLNSLESAPRVSEMARDAGMSPRQLQRRFLGAVGLAPKHFVRVVRFAKVWQLASMQPRETWAELAAAHGYADQAHMVREFRSFGAEPPTHVFTPEWYASTELSRASGSAKGVRSIQDRSDKPRA